MLTLFIELFAVLIYSAVVWMIGYRTGFDYGKWTREQAEKRKI